jgi:hypothetical protein
MEKEELLKSAFEELCEIEQRIEEIGRELGNVIVTVAETLRDRKDD